MKEKRWAILLMVCALLLSLLGVGYSKKADTGTSFTLMTWNILHGNGMIDKQKEQLKNYDADIVLLQEVDIGTRRIDGGNNMTDLADGLYPTALFGYECDYDTGVLGTSILTKGTLDDIVYKEGTEYAEIYHGYFHTTVELDGIDVSVYAVHLNYERSDWRAQQLYDLALDVDADKSRYIIVAGDFNLQDFDELNVLSTRLTAVNTDETYYPTYHGLDWNTQAIDNILYTAETLTVDQVLMPVNGYSDHNALYAKFTVK